MTLKHAQVYCFETSKTTLKRISEGEKGGSEKQQKIKKTHLLQPHDTMEDINVRYFQQNITILL